jgi:hypothetical protein
LPIVAPPPSIEENLEENQPFSNNANVVGVSINWIALLMPMALGVGLGTKQSIFLLLIVVFVSQSMVSFMLFCL